MYEMIQVGKNSFFMDCPAKVGIYRRGEKEAVLFDSGSDKDAAKKVKKFLDEQGLVLKAIYNTHSHADHIGGNRYLQEQTGCKIYAKGLERAFTEFPILEPTILYGGFTPRELHNKFLLAKESWAEELTAEALPQGVEMIALPGHSYDMVGFRTPDDVVFLADCLSSAETLEKYQIGYLYDVKAYLETLEIVKNLSAKCFVPSHANQTEDIVPLARLNIDKTKAIAQSIVKLLSSAQTFDELLRRVFDTFGLSMSLQQNMLVGSTVKSYLTYLKESGQVEFFFEDNRMLWRSVN